jgi:predicted nucleic acid-binding protein
MDAAVVVDASVWVSRFISWDINHNASQLWIQRYASSGGLLIAPALLLIEVAAAISRRIGDPPLTKGSDKGSLLF